MRKLFLTSEGIPEGTEIALLDLVGKDKSELKIAFIPSASDLYFDRGSWAFGTKEIFLRWKSQLTIIDLKKYIGRERELKLALSVVDLMWFGPGDIPILRLDMRRSGFENMVKELMEKMGVVYGAESAGAALVGPTLLPFINADQNSSVLETEGLPLKDEIKEGLNLVDFLPVPHWDYQLYQTGLRRIESEVKTMGYKIVPIKDKEALVVEGNTYKILTG